MSKKKDNSMSKANEMARREHARAEKRVANRHAQTDPQDPNEPQNPGEHTELVVSPEDGERDVDASDGTWGLGFTDDLTLDDIVPDGSQDIPVYRYNIWTEDPYSKYRGDEAILSGDGRIFYAKHDYTKAKGYPDEIDLVSDPNIVYGDYVEIGAGQSPEDVIEILEDLFSHESE